MSEDGLHIQWYPGHMAKARRMMEENAKLVDIICEIADARIPVSSRNPELDSIAANKPRLLILNRIDLADPDVTSLWRTRYTHDNIPVLETNCKSGKGIREFTSAARGVLSEKLLELRAKGQAGRPIRAMVVGIPNVGKSSFINRLAKRNVAATADKPGLTRGKQWITVDKGLELLDTPGLLWPKLEGDRTAENLAFTGAIKNEIIDRETLAFRLMKRLSIEYPRLLETRYKIDFSGQAEGWELLERAARKRGFIVSGGQADTERMANILLDEFRGGIIGRITLERP